jgi:hypothetical protein
LKPDGFKGFLCGSFRFALLSRITLLDRAAMIAVL